MSKQKKIPESIKDGLRRLSLLKPRYIRVCDGQLIATNDVCSFSWPIQDKYEAYPEFKMFKTIFSKIESEYAVTVFDSSDYITIVSNEFRGVINCSEDEFLENLSYDGFLIADPKSIAADNSIIDSVAFSQVAATCQDGQASTHCVFIGAKSSVGLDGVTFIEHSHNVAFPGVCAMTSEAAAILGKIKLPLIGIGGSKNSLTFHFENGAWFKTILASAQFSERGYSYLQDVSNLAQKPLRPLSEQIQSRISTIATTSKNGMIVFSNDGIYSSSDFEKSCSFDDGLSDDAYLFDSKKLKFLLKTKDVGFCFVIYVGVDVMPVLYFENRVFRGFIVGMKASINSDDGIPF